MSDDRILFLPPIWAPDPDLLESWPAPGALIRRLRQKWPVDFVRWPTLVDEPAEGYGFEMMANALRKARPAEHHVVVLEFNTPALRVLSEDAPISMVASSFRAKSGELQAVGESEVAATFAALTVLAATPSQIIPSVMRGANPDLVARASRATERSLQKQRMLELRNSLDDMANDREAFRFEAPLLYLTAEDASFGGEAAQLEILRAFAPNLRIEPVRRIYGWHRQEPGDEFADKVIPFIEEVIAARDGA